MNRDLTSYQFAEFSLEVGEHRLLNQGQEIYLRPKTFETLAYLVKHHGHLVRKNELLDAIWGDTAVTENALTRCIKEAREALKDDVRQPRFIETVPRIGYKFIAEVAFLTSQEPDHPRSEGTAGVVVHEVVEPPIDLASHTAPMNGEGQVPPLRSAVELPWMLQLTRSLWKRVAAVGAIVLVGLVVLVGVSYRANHREPPLPFGARDFVLITDFDNQTSEAIFDKSLLTAFTVSLEQSPHANVLPRTRISAALQRMGKKGETRIDEQVGREICLREHVRGMISCGITKTGREYALSARLVDPQSGAAVRSYFEPARNQDQIIEILGKITAQIRRDLGESLASIRQNDDPLPQVTTPSLEALRLFSEGKYLWGKGQYKEALKAYHSALEHDPDFAMAHAALGSVYMSHIFNKQVEGKQHYEIALQRANRITDRERLSVQASYQHSLGHVDEAVQNYRFYLKAYPDDATARFNLGVLFLQTARHEEAIKEFKDVLRLDPMFARAWINLATSYSDLDRPSESLANYAKAFELEPGWVTLGNLNHEYGFTLVRNGDIPKAREVFALALAKRDMQEYALRSLALADMYEGKYRDAQARLRQAIRISEDDPEPLSRSRHHSFLAILLDGQGDRVGQLRELDRAMEALEKGSSPPAWMAARIGAGYARAGDVGKAAGILRKIRSQTDRDNPLDSADFHILEGEIALASGDYTRGIEKLQLGAQAIPLPMALASLARAYQRAGNTEQAIACQEKLLGLGRRALGWEPQQSWLRAHADLAEMYLSRGEKDKASRMIGELARLWKDADPSIPLVKRIIRLQKEIQEQ